VPRWLARLPLAATLDGSPVALNVPIPVIGDRVELRLTLLIAREDALVRASARCVVPVVAGRETVVGGVACNVTDAPPLRSDNVWSTLV
jgi:hypothetical protein